MKKLMIALAVGAFVLSMAGVSLATDVNIYGASAQFNFWSAQAPSYLTSTTNGGAACNSTTLSTGNYIGTNNNPTGVYWHGAKYFIASAGSCNTSVVPDGSLTIRVTAYDSVDGLEALLGNTNLTDINACTGSNRAMLNNAAAGSLTNFNCFPVILGAADVDGSSITESDSETQLDGPAGPSTTTYPYDLAGAQLSTTIDLSSWNGPGSAYSITYEPVDTTSSNSLFNDYHPFVLPFGIFANKAVNSSDSTNQLQANLTNFTTEMAQLIFSGAATDWSQFGIASGTGGACAGGGKCPITPCFRQPGSGSFGLFDHAVMKTNGEGAPLPSNDKSVAGGVGWFNFTSSDMMNCINTIPGAIGFADADQGNSANTYGPINFNGAAPNNANVVNGAYDRFFSLEHIFELKTNAGNSHTVITNMVNWSYVTTNNPRPTVWAVSNTLNWHKQTDNTYLLSPGGYTEGSEY